MNWDRLMKQKSRIGTPAFVREYLCEHSDDSMAIIKDDWIKYYELIPADENIVETRITCDPAGSDKQNNDFTAIAVIHRTNRGRFYVEKLYNEHISSKQLIELLKNIQMKYENSIVIFEAIGSFQVLIPYLKEAGLLYKVIKHKLGKEVELRGVSQYFENGYVLISEKIDVELRNLLVEQLVVFKPPHDDLRDALIMGIKKVGVEKGMNKFNRDRNIIKSFRIPTSFYVQAGVNLGRDTSYIVYRGINENNQWFFFASRIVKGTGIDVAENIIQFKKENNLTLISVAIDRRERLMSGFNENTSINGLIDTLYMNDIDTIQIKSEVDNGVINLNNKFEENQTGMSSAFVFDSLPTLQAQIENMAYDNNGSLIMEDQQFAYAAILLSCLNSKYYDIEDEIEEDDDVI